MISGVLQGSIFGSMLVAIWYHETLRQVTEVEYAFTLQEDLHSMYKWSQDWQLLFNFNKCKCLHIGYNNPIYDYFIGDECIESTDMETDLGVYIQK